MDYKKIYEEHAGDTSSKGLCCPDSDLHDRRLALTGSVISNYWQPAMGMLTVLDVGCGFGDLTKWLPRGVEYTGIDGVEWIVEEAERRYPDKDFRCCEMDDEFDDWDVVVSLGTIATMESLEMESFVQLLASKAIKLLVLTWQDAEKYNGSFKKYRQQDIEFAVGSVATKIRTEPDDTEVTGIWVMS